MKATIDAKGWLTIESETPLESYALGVWCEGNFEKLDGAKMLIVHRCGNEEQAEAKP
jgi:hypothetical protein